MNGITVTMAIVDFIPVVLFFIAALILQKDFYAKMSRSFYTLLAAGSMLVFIGGAFKATWKILYALNVCDYQALDISFFPMQGTGFLLVFIALLGANTTVKNKVLSVVPVFVSNMPFVILQIIGCAGTQFTLLVKAIQMKKNLAAVFYILAFIFMLGMGYLSAKFDDSSSMHWIAQCTNIISQGSFLAGTMILHKAGLGE